MRIWPDPSNLTPLRCSPPTCLRRYARRTFRDVARVELGGESYDMTTRLNGHPGGVGVMLSCECAGHGDAGCGHHPDRGDRTGGGGDVPVPAEHPRHADTGAGGAGRSAWHLWRAGAAAIPSIL
ncbi:hypothetical protein EVAR_101263_1 [Eumeta japonica]|uniref:Cytochrome b5 heme-binding domain-containing protein n=1 Tax=Eumeta variegata TaxID=151549 RepID=A0A4C1SRA7_EUMVA|nr:hypothetical protein EVAR_101263_1 [Eumeta japonica]